MIVSTLKKIYQKMNGNAVHGASEERMPYSEQMEYLRRFSDPRDDFERSFYKFKCFCEYCYYKQKWMVVLYNLGALFLLPSVHGNLKKTMKNAVQKEKKDAVIENIPRLPIDDVIPDELTGKYKSVKEIDQIDYSQSLWSEGAEEIYRELKKRYFFHFYYRMIVTQKLGQFSRYLECYDPDAIIFYSCEREFSGPLQTRLCEKYGTEYISYMHGDYLSTLSFAFQKYSHYYVWDPSYVKMFEELKCDFPTTIYQPAKLKGIAKALPPEECRYFATYYFSDETRTEAVRIQEVFREFEALGLRTKIRPHPRFSDVKMLEEVFEGILIEKPREYPLSDSVTESLYIIGLNTTVLSEAFFSGKEVVIDDVSSYEKYRHLEERGYIMIRRKHILLSELRESASEQYNGQDGRHYAFRKE